MVIPGYDPEDIDDALERQLSEDDIERLLTREEWDAYRNGDASLLDLLSSSEIRQLRDRGELSLDELE